MFFINYHLPLNDRVIEELSILLFMCHIHRSSDLYDIIVKLNSSTDSVSPETMIQDIREIDNVNSIMTLKIADDDKIDGVICSSFSLGNLRVGN